MTGPGAGNASRMRIVGIVLLAVAAVAAVVGLVALGSQGGSPSRNTALPSAAPAAPAPNAPLPGSVPAGPPPAPASPSAPAPAAPAPPVAGPAGAPAAAAPIVPSAEPPAPAAAPGSGSGGATGSGGGSAAGGGTSSTSAVPVRVLNNSMISGLAERAAGELRMRGWNVVEVGNYPSGVIPLSTVYFRPGTEEQGAADTVAAQFGIRSEPRFPGIANASPGLIVIATNNWDTSGPKS